MKIPEGLKLVALDEGGVIGCCAPQDDWGRRPEGSSALHLWNPSAQEFVYAITAARKGGPKLVIAYVRDYSKLSPDIIDHRAKA